MTPLTDADDTSARLHDATSAGVPLLIPGALEPRLGRAVQTIAGAVAAVVKPTASKSPEDRGRLEYEREGGGAPSQRRVGRPGFLARLAHCLLYPGDLPTLWRHQR